MFLFQKFVVNLCGSGLVSVTGEMCFRVHMDIQSSLRKTEQQMYPTGEVQICTLGINYTKLKSTRKDKMEGFIMLCSKSMHLIIICQPQTS